MARITLSNLAERSGLSKFAVSRALSGKSGVSDKTRERVLALAAELGYERPVAAADISTIAVIFHDLDLINSELHMLIQNGIQAQSQILGYRVAMRWTHSPKEIGDLVANSSGAILVGPHGEASLERAYGAGKPIVRMGWIAPLEPVDQVQGTDHEAGSAVANFLLELGHRSIAYIHGSPGYRGRIERYYGMREVMEKRNDVRFVELQVEEGVRFSTAFQALVDKGQQPTALFCAHDGLAVTVVSELLRLGYGIPDQVSIVGFGDYSSASQISPSLTTVAVNGAQMGMASVRLLDDRINNRIADQAPMRIQIAGRIIERQSSAPRHRA